MIAPASKAVSNFDCDIPEIFLGPLRARLRGGNLQVYQRGEITRKTHRLVTPGPQKGRLQSQTFFLKGPTCHTSDCSNSAEITLAKPGDPRFFHSRKTSATSYLYNATCARLSVLDLLGYVGLQHFHVGITSMATFVQVQVSGYGLAS